MKKFVPIALLVCVLFSLSSFAPIHKPAFAIKSGKFVTWPITGTDPYSSVSLPLTYVISGSGTTPSNISFYDASNTLIASSSFTVYSSSPGGYIAEVDPTYTGVRAVIYHNTSGFPGYGLDWIPGL